MAVINVETVRGCRKMSGTFFLCVLTTWTFCQSKRIASFEVSLPKSTEGISIPVAVDLGSKAFAADSLVSLELVEGKKRTVVPFQISGPFDGRRLYWQVSANGPAKQVYELVKRAPVKFSNLKGSMEDGKRKIRAGNKDLLWYNYDTVYPPRGIDSVFRRSGFIHPLWTLSGKELTRIHAPDHYHHFGIWNPWTHVLFEGDTVDFWNLKSRQGTVRFSHFMHLGGMDTEGPVFAEYDALHEHVVFKPDGTEKVALNERQEVCVYRPDDSCYVVDVRIVLFCATPSPFKILQYRYAGLGWRATEKWNKDNSEVLTSEGKTRKDADGTNAKWFFVQGSLDDQYGGMAMLGYPTNFDFPEPLRIWPENSNGGEVFAMFAPTKNKDWLLEPGREYTLRYRFVVFDDHFSRAKAEAAWNYFAQPPVVTIRFLKKLK
jgi:hypothetical protein